MYCLVDIGNSGTKIATVVEQKIVSIDAFKTEELFYNRFNKLVHFIKSRAYKACIISSVVQPDLLHDVIKQEDRIWMFHPLQQQELTLDYATPETLGADRVAAAIGAIDLFTESNVIVIDAGTCITCDFVINRTFHGGAISPGISMRLAAMNKNTSALPLPSMVDSVDVCGKSTQEALLSGAINGSLFELQGYINYYTTHYKSIQVVITGGDYLYFADKLKCSIFAEPQLIFKGLLKVLKNKLNE